MNKEQLMRWFQLQGLKLKKHAPTIMIVGGVAGMTTGAVLACVATAKGLEPTVERAEKRINDAKMATEGAIRPVRSKELTKAYVQTALDFGKLYGSSVALEATSAALIFGSHNIMQKRNASLAAMYAAIDQAFRRYRKRVVEKVGEAEERDIYLNKQKVSVTHMNEDGSVTEEVIEEINPDIKDSPFLMFFDCGSREYRYLKDRYGHDTSDADNAANLDFLLRSQAAFGERLAREKVVFINDVRKDLDLPLTKDGYKYGWLFTTDKRYKGDLYVDYGIYSKENNKFFEDDASEAILLNLNATYIADIFDQVVCAEKH